MHVFPGVVNLNDELQVELVQDSENIQAECSQNVMRNIYYAAESIQILQVRKR